MQMQQRVIAHRVGKTVAEDLAEYFGARTPINFRVQFQGKTQESCQAEVDAEVDADLDSVLNFGADDDDDVDEDVEAGMEADMEAKAIAWRCRENVRFLSLSFLCRPPFLPLELPRILFWTQLVF